ncbi:MAG: 1-deoxy-D-xylulose-5-phosphate reductoisomerase, partial [Sphingomonadales bacterium]|nr:1-deoxy-D-xylulose-5-phosphate reductoisomerase [Sphingomonadales bacterium]
ATMMNKGLELIEAFHLYPLAENQIDILVHPQSVIHSMVEYVDGSVLGQMGSPDMRTPISYCMAWPERISAPVERLDFAKLGTFTFETPDEVRFPALKLSREALKQGGAAPAVLNAANEIAVAAFLDKKIGFLDITRVVDRVLSKDGLNSIASLDDVFETDRVARISAREIMKQL